MQRDGFVVIVFLPQIAVGSCVFLQEDVCGSNARKNHPVPEENQNRESTDTD